MIKIVDPTKENIQLAAQILRKGGLVAIPTETVYGLAADATNPEAISKIFKAKGRPADHPLIVHLFDKKQLSDWAIDIPDIAWPLIDAFWPGPLTLILRKHPSVSPLITGKQDTIGIRIPNHPIALAILQEMNGAVAAPSANKHCHISPTTAQHVLEELGDQVDLIVDGGPCKVGIESTIINLSSKQPEILRPGMISVEQIAAVLHQPIQANKTSTSPRFAGDMEKHYAPYHPALLVSYDQLLNEIHQTQDIAVLSQHNKPVEFKGIWFTLSSNPLLYAKELYAKLREADHAKVNRILIEAPPKDAAWDAIYNRLVKACAVTS